ncbi:hypothetical protein [Salinicola sp. CR57]|uniref:hypothetical protein n=1 Tax=Salinicola sp. CR57 TaxID=1949086 RepID=UPI0013008705|nr:hypothetical protein [Salinicola sp. CR57]
MDLEPEIQIGRQREEAIATAGSERTIRPALRQKKSKKRLKKGYRAALGQRLPSSLPGVIQNGRLTIRTGIEVAPVATGRWAVSGFLAGNGVC